MSEKSSGGLRYVTDFEFPADQGFSGSAGRSEVKGYMRGGSVKGRNKPNTRKKLAKGTTRAAMGGSIGDAPGQQKMGFQDGKEIDVGTIGVTVRAKGGPVGKGGARQKMPRNVKAKGGSVHDKLMSHGKKMGFKQGGYAEAKDTSAEFRAKRGKQDTMDTGNQPARRGGNARSQQDRESGGTGRLRPGLKKGGRAKKYGRGGLAEAAGAAAGAAAGGVGAGVGRAAKKIGRALRSRKKSPDHTKGKGMSKKGMPKNVKARGGAVAAGDKKAHPAGKGRKPYSGYNKQPAGHGAPSARYLGKRGAAR